MSLYKNSYRVPLSVYPTITEDEEYDLNFCFPVPNELNSDRVKLLPFIPALHTEQYLLGTSAHPELYQYLPYGPFTDKSDFYRFIAERISYDHGTVLFTIIDKTKPDPVRPSQGGTFAGVIAYLNTNSLNLSTEIGHLLILPPWQRTFLTTNAVGLLLKYGLELPENGGLGLRRVQWQASHMNKPSVRCAERMGMQLEGIIRWQRTLQPGKDGEEARSGDPVESLPGRHTAMLALCWDNYSRQRNEALMARQV